MLSLKKSIFLIGLVCSVISLSANAQERSYAGAAIGAVVGGILGNQVGDGSGRTAATVAGAVAGGFIGDRIEHAPPAQQPLPAQAPPPATERPGVYLAGDPQTDYYRCTSGGLCWMIRNGVPDERHEYRPDFQRSKGYLCNADGRCYRVVQ